MNSRPIRTDTAILLAVLLLHGPALGQNSSDEELEEELSTLADDDFPDLVSASDMGELGDELAFLQDDSQIELAARHRQEIGMSPSAVWVITREEIDTSGANNITDLLRRVPGMEVVSVAPYFPAVTSRINWTYENTSYLVLIDGREAYVECLGFTPWSLLSLGPEDIERIEVIRGPASSLYGANALAGVISITTRSRGQQDLRIYLEGGEYSLVSTGVEGAGQMGDFHFNGRVGFDLLDRLGGAPHLPGKKVLKLHGRVEYTLADSDRLILDSGASVSEGMLPSLSGDLVTDFYLLNVLAEYRSSDVRARLFWTFSRADGIMDTDLVFAGVTLANFSPNVISAYTLDAEFQWTLPIDYEPLIVIMGAGGRSTWVDSPILLNFETFSDINHRDYHKPGLDYWEIRAGAFVHAELKPARWVTLTGGARFDFNTASDEAFSPRLAAVFTPVESQFIRLGVGSSFRKPNMWETRLHPNVVFPEGGVFTGSAQDGFREFMSRMVGNAELANEKLVALETGYLGRFLDETLIAGLDFYYNIYSDVVAFTPNIVPHDQWIIDLDASDIRFENMSDDIDVIGLEFSLRYKPSRKVSFLFVWTHREAFLGSFDNIDDQSPKNLFTLGGHFNTDWGGLGSLYIHTRSEFTDGYISNPAGLFEPQLAMKMPNVALILARWGYRFGVARQPEMEMGVKLMLPVSMQKGSTFRYYERGGGETLFGIRYGGDPLSRVMTAYLKGSF